MDKGRNSLQPAYRVNHHKRQSSESSNFVYNSLTPSSSKRHLNFDKQNNETSVSSSKCASPHPTHRAAKEQQNKAISLVIIEKYFSDICQNIANKNLIEKNLLVKATTMQDVLKDCLTAVPDISLQFYVLMASALKEIQLIGMTQDSNLYSPLAKKLVQIAGLLEDGNYTSEVDRIATQPNEEIGACGLRNIAAELSVRVARVTARILNLWKKILSTQREAAVISCGFLLLYCEVDVSLKILPTARIPAEKAVDSMKLYLNNPGYVVTVIRKTKEYIENEQISVETVRRINDLLQKVTVEQVKNMDKTLTGFAIYELVWYAVKFYYEYAKEHYRIDIFETEDKGIENKEEVKGNFFSPPKNEEIKNSVFDETRPRVKVSAVAKAEENNKTLPGNEAKLLTHFDDTAKSPEKPLRSPEKPLKGPEGAFKSNRILERSKALEGTPRTSGKATSNHHKSRTALYSPSGCKDSAPKLQRKPSLSSPKMLLSDRKNLSSLKK